MDFRSRRPDIPVGPGRSTVALVTAFSLVATPAMGLLAATGLAPAGQATSEAAATDADVDLGWPRHYDTPTGGAVVVYQPQVESWVDQRQVRALAAVSYTATDAAEAALGVITLESDTQVSLDERLVDFSTFSITESNFPSLGREKLREVVTELAEALPTDERVIALDRFLEMIDKSQLAVHDVEGVKADPPKIFWSTSESALVNVDGDPIWAPIEGLDLQFAVNTNWDLFQHTDAGTATLYLRNDNTWLRASALEGPWVQTRDLPDSFSNLPDDDNWAETKDNLPGRFGGGGSTFQVFTSTEPAELIALDGEPEYETVAGTSLEWVANTESDLFRMGRDGSFYYLVAGRWFSAPALDGPWTFATTSLPEDFRQIAVEHERSRVLAAVPGSDQANEAVLLAQMPRTARVNKNEIESPEVIYQGDPEFVEIEPTSLERAVNTDKDIIKAGDTYYLCVQGVWFTGASATGPWELATTVPQEVYEIPASSPAHHVTYVTVEEDDDDSDAWVTFAYVAGYTGMMIAWGCVVWGSGWYYPPYYGYGAYYRYPVTYGMGAWYNPWSGTYGRGAGVYGPYGGAGWGARYNPRSGTYARGAAAYGPYNSRGAAQAWNPRTGTYAQTRQGSNVYGSWGSTSVQRGDDWAQTARVTNNRTDTTTRVTRTDDGAAVTRRSDDGFVGRTSDGDVYAGRDGNVYRQGDDGWQKREDGGWSSVDSPERSGDQQRAQTATQNAQPERQRQTDQATVGQLERDRSSRASGTTRTQDYSRFQRGGSQRSSAGGYRSGGRSRGGGRRR